ncbi:enoyl-CoA hydratase-related protein [Spongiactinospora sp. TRM90649]|uniref:enoyl-CoA hydratase/isomerase family protein n=1 Tax=Spongiactinospora sp. TRM90649 TaxID=3031114 RepID=UPI0023F94795|nr:enoyl-CoA hydratase-related protein [Spongiactinospora sp. TRM90649]MDF5751670.1 enoyl-CoA hydratase-related protein [Spongiactinospora sp. TRM90649]
MEISGLKSLTWHMDGAVGVLTLNRPERLNAIANRDIDELDRVVMLAGRDPGVRALLITGAGRGFCSGADVKEWHARADHEEESWPAKMHRVITRLYWLPKPVVAAVNGVAVGAGCDLALTADMRFASTAARFGEVYAQRGICPDAGGSYLLPRIVGEARAAELIYTGRIVDAAEALGIGLVTEVVAPEELLGRAMEQARTFAAGPTIAIGEAKQNIRRSHSIGIEEALRGELRAGRRCAETEDMTEGLRAAVEKRAPIFRGR